jgi:anti-sigma B factor antagonist
VLSALDCGVRGIVLDLSPTDYVDSAGLGTLVLLTKRAREAGARMILSGLNDRICDLLRLTRLDQVLELCSTLDEGRRLAASA